MRVATDIGGTFTDLVYLDENGRIGVAKSDTTPPNFEQGVIDVIKKSGISPEAITTFIHGTTVIINALTERKGAKTGLITTKGFRDVLEIARGNRPDLFNVRYRKPAPFVPRYLRLEVSERLNYKGEVITELATDEVRAAVEQLRKEGVEAIAVSFLHAYANPVHEKLAVEIIKELWPEVAVTASYEVTREWREYERTSTAVLNSYVKPIASSYIDKLDKRLREIGVNGNKYIMQSNSGTTTFEQSKETPINMVESGPVAGIFGAAILGKILGEENIIAFDIGGTTAKCSLIDNGEVKVTTEYRIERDDRHAGYPIKVPVVDIVEIGNGGGSIAWIDDAGSLKVGPQSAGAMPGPVAYGRGGENPTTTDANLVTGRLSPKNFQNEVDMNAVKQAIYEKVAKYFGISVEEAALGIIRIANSNMLNALKLISVRKGYDPREFSLVAFGGGGPMHAMALAKELGVKKVIVPVAASVFSAWGMLMTDLRHDYIQTYIRRVSELNLDELNREWDQLETAALQQYSQEGISEDKVLFARYADMRYVGQEHAVKVPVPNGVMDEEAVKEMVSRFHHIHEKHYTFKLDGAPTEIVNLHLTAFGVVQKPEIARLEKVGDNAEEALKEVRPVLFEDHGWIDTNVYDRGILNAGSVIHGPAIVEESSTSTVVYPGQTLEVDEYGNLIIHTGV
ncbi:hydantoinase/oxoprolinase family protein [Geobacillus thermoleovorans]|uniref:N-methylhydantoinase A n=2 Tax=Geobacillus TaxID=129337 RepID=Q5KVV7_GEOKA|nr:MULTISPECIES: hydantoinase/oxoprolinase family protein [Geobacillus]ESU73454.1 5-oxoprolinase [Geobacillus sp. MAS1]UPT60416.1 hydantoinase/oxoprolinase family protein [Geobacillus thermoleovorans]BAD77179.1 N-methylhydantoinase A [Geobacillus kaustophilus HTA426]